MTVRVRFAPSPTGYLHIGGARTALFNWLFARRHNGRFILRIEDTDQTREVEGAAEALMESMRWLGLDWDEGPDVGGDYGPYVQTQRAHLYTKWANWLVDNGHGYKCFCTADELTAAREHQMANKLSLGYNRRCRNLTTEQVAEQEAAGKTYVIRFKMPIDGETIIPDIIRGDITVNNEQIQDMVLLKSDALPTYHLANVVDDHLMEITHIMRADEWISTAPLHINMYAAFGWEPPIYVHLPVVLNPSGKGKLSKRTQAFLDNGEQVLVQVEEFQEAGYLPVAIRNFLANVGWSFGDDREIFKMDEAIPRFELENINPAPSQLPYSKLSWLNGQYIQQMEPTELAQFVKPYLDAAGLEVNPEALLVVMPPMSMRMRVPTDAIDFLRFLFDDVTFEETAVSLTHKKMDQTAAQSGFQQLRDLVATMKSFDVASLSEAIPPIGESVTDNSKAGPFLGTTRRAITSQKVSPPLYESMVALGRKRVLARLDEILALYT